MPHSEDDSVPFSQDISLHPVLWFPVILRVNSPLFSLGFQTIFFSVPITPLAPSYLATLFSHVVCCWPQEQFTIFYTRVCLGLKVISKLHPPSGCFCVSLLQSFPLALGRNCWASAQLCSPLCFFSSTVKISFLFSIWCLHTAPGQGLCLIHMLGDGWIEEGMLAWVDGWMDG